MKLTIDNDKEFSLPENWEEVSLGKYCEILDIATDETKSITLKKIKMISALSNNYGELYKHLSDFDDYNELEGLFDAFNWLYDEPDITGSEPKDIFDIDGDKFKLKSNYDKLTVDEVVMIEELNASNKYQFHPFEVAFGVLFRKLGSDGNEVDTSLDLTIETIMKFRDKVTLSDVFGVVSFFLNGEKGFSSKSSKSSSQRLKIKMENGQLRKKPEKA